MDFNTVTSMIGTLGFPIAMCLLMWHSMEENNKMHKEEVDGLKEVINQNTIALNKINDRLDFLENDKK